MSEVFVSDRCISCKGVFHPATGHAFSETAMLCGRCALEFKNWLKGRMGAMDATSKRHPSAFSTAAALSIHGGGPDEQ